MNCIHQNYVNLLGGGFKETTREIGWVSKNGEWWADYADKLSWHNKSDGFWIQKYKK